MRLMISIYTHRVPLSYSLCVSICCSQGRLYNVEDPRLLTKYMQACSVKSLDDSNDDNDGDACVGNNQYKAFQGGSFRDLHRMLNITCGDKILYVGDHMFADVVKYVWAGLAVLQLLESFHSLYLIRYS